MGAQQRVIREKLELIANLSLISDSFGLYLFSSSFEHTSMHLLLLMP